MSLDPSDRVSTSRAARRIGFAGSPLFAATVLRGLIAAGFTIPCVYSQPDRPAGRGRKLRSSAVKQLALEWGIETRTPRSLKPPSEVSALSAFDLDVLVVAAYGLLLPPPVLSLPRRGCINVHASLLPRWRGAAPIERAMIEGDTVTGVSIMQMDAGLDTGAVWKQTKLAIPPGATGDEMHQALAALGTRTLIDVLDGLDDLRAVPQPEIGVTLAPKLVPNDSRLDFVRPAHELVRRIHALNSRQPAAAILAGHRIRLLRATAASAPAGTSPAPGEIVAADRDAIEIACGERTVLRATLLQLPGKNPAQADALVRGHLALFAVGARWTALPDAAR